MNKESIKEEILNRLSKFMVNCYNTESEDSKYVTCHVDNNSQIFKVHDMVKDFTINNRNISGFIKNLYTNNDLYILFENNNTLNYDLLNQNDIYTVIDFFQSNYFRDVV